MIEPALIQNARDYASRHQLDLAERLGFGVHGIIFVAENNLKVGKTAVKAHRHVEPFRRERDAYLRLKDARISDLIGFHVPQLMHFDDGLQVIEMSIVARPFVLDFAGAWLDRRPEFPEENWTEWEAEKRGQFEERWPKVRELLEALEALGIHMVDVSPTNVAFLE